jgi:hypothetical protein
MDAFIYLSGTWVSEKYIVSFKKTPTGCYVQTVTGERQEITADEYKTLMNRLNTL